MNREENRKEKIEQGADKVTKWIGSAGSLVVHTLLFSMCFVSIILGADFDRVMLVLTTVVSLEAIYLSIFIQMTINRHTKELEEVSEDIEEIQVDVGEIQKDVDEIQEDVENIEKDVDEIQEDVDEIQKDVDEIQEDVEEIEGEVVNKK
jgi:peptidoglycan hydrolase CwlO-like protein